MIYPLPYKFENTEKLNVTEWFKGDTAPELEGWYERSFSDGLYINYWNGIVWTAYINGDPHWRQVGSYPTWRGLKEDYKISNLEMAMLLAEDFKNSISRDKG